MPKLKPHEDIAECKVHSVKALTKMPNIQEASNLLQRLVQSTKALLVRKKWKVLLLTEFYPKNPSLLGLNVNHGYKIMIRLRSSDNSNSFLPWESLLGTLIHELVHIEIGAHSFEFYSMLDKLSDEVQEDILHRRNESVVMWTSSGLKLGGASLSVESTINRSTMAVAAEKRLQYQKIAGQSALLGGDANKLKQLSQRDLILQAVERRNQDAKRCSTGDNTNGTAHELSKEEEEFLLLNTQEIDWTAEDTEPPLPAHANANTESDRSLCHPCSSSSSSSSSTVAVVSVVDFLGGELAADHIPVTTKRKRPSDELNTLAVTQTLTESKAEKIKERGEWQCAVCLEVNDWQRRQQKAADSVLCSWCGSRAVPTTFTNHPPSLPTNVTNVTIDLLSPSLPATHREKTKEKRDKDRDRGEVVVDLTLSQ